MKYANAFFVAPVVANDEETTRVARLLMNVLWGSIVAALVTLPPALLTTEDPRLQIGLHAFTIIISLISVRSIRRGKVHLVAAWLPVVVCGVMLISMVFGHRPFSIGVSIGMIAVVFVGLLAQRRRLIVVVMMNVTIAVLAMAYWLIMRPSPYSLRVLLADGMAFIWFSIIMGFVAFISASQLRQALEQARHSKRQIAEHNAALEREIAEHRVTERSLAARTRELTQVLEMSRRVSATLDLRQMLDLIVDSLRPVVHFNAITIHEITDQRHMHVLIHCGDGPVVDRWQYDPQRDVHLVETLGHQALAVIPNIWAETPEAKAYRALYARLSQRLPESMATVAYVPLVVRGTVIGLMTLQHADAEAYDRSSLQLVTAFASQIAVSIENARLHRQAVQAAALTERSRLARELHDSVSQALFGIVLGSRTLLMHSVRDTQNVPTVEYVLSLAEAALAEMRALIFELRPESLQSEGLVSAFRKQATALCSRHKINVEVDILDQEPDLSIEAKEALYRIGLEAIQNTIKHANASRVNLRLAQESNLVLLEIKDDGRGFDANGNFPGHLGLLTMRERAEQLGGSLQLRSEVGQGTQIRVQLPLLHMIASHVVNLPLAPCAEAVHA